MWQALLVGDAKPRREPHFEMTPKATDMTVAGDELEAGAQQSVGSHVGPTGPLIAEENKLVTNSVRAPRYTRMCTPSCIHIHTGECTHTNMAWGFYS